jgi:predicted cupin superfamily sugar epimerase
MNELDALITQLQLKPHPEGGFYRETYRDKYSVDIANLGRRNFSTCIYYLLTADTFSAFHRIKQDEIWHFYLGKPVHLHLIDSKGEYSEVLVGNNITENQTPQVVVPAYCWFAAHVESDFALVGCTVSPGFDFSDFELANREELIRQFTDLSEIITHYTR